MPRRLASIQVVRAANQPAKDFCNHKPEAVNARSAALRRRPGVCIAPTLSAPIFFLLPLFAAVVLTISPSVSRAAGTVDNWTGGTAGSWTLSSATWSAAAIPTATYDAIFNAVGINANETITFSSGGTADGLIFNNTGTTLLEGNTTAEILTLEGDGITVNSGAGAVTLGSTTTANFLNVTLGAAQSWTNSSGSTLTDYNGITNGGFLLTVKGTGNTTLNGVVSGSGGLTMSGSGTLILAGTNTFTGGLTVSGGTVQFTADANLGGGAGAVTLNGGTLNETSLAASFTTAHLYTIGAGGGTFNIAGNSPWTGAKMQFSTANTNITGSGTITKIGGGDMYITQSQNFTGAWNINGGFVEVTNATGLGSGAVTINSVAGSTGELTGNGANIANPLTLDANAILATDDDINTSTQFSGGITLAGAATMTPSNFYSGNTVALVMTASGKITGTGSLTENLANEGYAPTGNGLHGTVVLNNATNNYGGGTTITSGTLQIGASSVTTGSGAGLGITSGATSTGLVTVNGTLDLSSFNLAVGGLSGSSLGTIASSSKTTAGSLTIVVPALTTDTYSGVIANITSNYTATFNTATAGNQTVSLTMGGSGTEILSGVNTFTGTTTVIGGTLEIGSGGVLGSGTSGGTAVTVNGGTFLDQSTVATTGGLTGSSSLTVINGSATMSGINNYTGTTTVTGGVLLGTAASGTPFGTGNVTLAGGTLALAPASGAAVALSSVNAAPASTFTYSGGGTLSLSIRSATSVAYTVGNSAATSAILARSGTGTLVIASLDSPSSLSGLGSGLPDQFLLNSTAIAAIPILTNGMINASIVGQSADVNKSGDFLTTYTSGSAAGFSTVTYTDMNFASPSNTTVDDVTTAQSSLGSTNVFALNAGANIALAPGATLSIGNYAATATATQSPQAGMILDGGATISGGTALAFGPAEGLIYTSLAGGSIATPITGSGGITLFGPGALTLGGPNTETGTTTVNSGTLMVGASSTTTGSGATLAIVNGATGTGVLAVDGGTVDLSTFNLDVAGLSGTGGAIASSSTGIPGSLTIVTGATPETYSGTITNVTGGGNQTVSLNVAGTGTQVLSGPNTFSGGTTLTFGTLAVGVSSATTGSGATLSIANGATGTGLLTVSGGTLDLSTFNLAVGGLSGSGGTIASSSTGTAGALTIVTGATPETYSGTITNTTGSGTKAVSLAVGGSGTQVLSGMNTFTGGTTLSAGTLAVGINSATISSGPTLSIVNGATGTGLLTVNGGTLDLSTFNLAVGGLSGTGGTIASSSTTTAGSLTILAGTTQTYSGTIANTTGGGSKTVAVTVAGTGTQVFSGTNTFTGGLTVNGATVQYTAEANLGAGTITINNGGTINQTSNTSAFTAGVYSFGAGGAR